MDGRHRRTGNGPPGQNPAYRPTRPSPPARRTGLGAVRQVRPEVLRDHVGHGGKVLPTIYLNQSYAQARADRTASAAMSSSRTRRVTLRTDRVADRMAERGGPRQLAQLAATERRRRHLDHHAPRGIEDGPPARVAAPTPRDDGPARDRRPQVVKHPLEAVDESGEGVGGQEPLAVTLRGRPWCPTGSMAPWPASRPLPVRPRSGNCPGRGGSSESRSRGLWARSGTRRRGSAIPRTRRAHRSP